MDDTWIRMAELAIGVIGTVVAAFMGAKVAFGLERKRDREQQEDSEADGLQSAVFVLCRQLTLMGNLQQDVLDPLRHDRNRDFRVPPVSGRHLLNARVDFDWISHMLRDHEESAALAFLIVTVDDNVESLHDAVEARRKFHDSRIRPKLEEAGITVCSDDNAQQLRYLCGAADSELLQQHTDRVYAACDLAIGQAQRALDEARRVCLQAFPGYTFKFVLPEWAHHVPETDKGGAGSGVRPAPLELGGVNGPERQPEPGI